MTLNDNQIADVTPLSSLTGLTYLNLDFNHIADVDNDPTIKALKKRGVRVFA